ncbi:MAG: glycerol-3-phosphate dehydrogenase [Candidatus Omnitrophica bacterium CG07_land_8_20_14_0_80_50_8]|nr:MAG: glycerol-3-phosphate dehydrogenase [Candidatus Omnitrophica bacterium CG07_land_8_20_14_0_80_50_8]
MLHKDTKICILGDGGWGTALSILLAGKGYRITLWGAFPSYVREVQKKRENRKFLPGFKIPENVKLVSNIHEACAGSEWIVLAIPSQFMRSVLYSIKKDELSHKYFVTVAKGIETKTLKVMSQVIREELGRVNLAVVSGPTIAREVALKMPVAASVASANSEFTSKARQLFTTEYFGLFESDDMLGVELGGSLKNVIAICAGILEGMGYGSNTRAFLFARGVAEISRLGRAMGAKRETFMGLSGLGDLATTCLSPHSRNRWLGEEIGKAKALGKILKETEMVVEGVETAKAAYRLSKKYKVSMPITHAVYQILFNGHDPKEAVSTLMKRGSHNELD